MSDVYLFAGRRFFFHTVDSSPWRRLSAAWLRLLQLEQSAQAICGSPVRPDARCGSLGYSFLLRRQAARTDQDYSRGVFSHCSSASLLLQPIAHTTLTFTVWRFFYNELWLWAGNATLVPAKWFNGLSFFSLTRGTRTPHVFVVVLQS